jgi:HprK-related kinase A
LHSGLTIGDISRAELRRRLTCGGIRVRIGPIVAAIQSSVTRVHEGIELHYRRHDVVADDEFADFHIALEPSRALPRWLPSPVVFRSGSTSPFKPLPSEQAFALFEWGINWTITAHCHQYMMLHSAVVARDDRALILPAPPGSGKSTLCAALVARGWRLLSDELTVIEPDTGRVVPLPRPISLKNRSIDAIRKFWSDAGIGEPINKTLKGTVTYVRPPAASVGDAGRYATPRWIVLPRYAEDQSTRLAPVSKAKAFMQLVDNGFNYDVYGRRGFEQLARITEACDCLEFVYGGALGEAVRLFEDLGNRS